MTDFEQQIRAGLAAGKLVRVEVDASWCAVPEHLQHNETLLLELALNMPVPVEDLSLTEAGFSATLSFEQEPGVVSVPWSAVLDVHVDKLKPLVKVREQLGMFDEEPAPETDPMAQYRAKVDADIETIGAIGTLKKQWALEDAESVWARQAANDTREPDVFNPGDVVEFTAKHIWQTSCGLEQAGPFTLQACTCDLCALGNHVCTTELAAFFPGYRHLHHSVIRHHRAPHVDDVPVGLQPLVTIPRVPAALRWLNREDRKARGLPLEDPPMWRFGDKR